MVKNYSYFIYILVLFFAINVSAQDTKQQPKIQEATIEGLSLYPNPVSNGKVYIYTKEDLNKEITIFDILGKKVLHAQLVTKELNVSSLSPGVYIIKITENQATAIRKLIIR